VNHTATSLFHGHSWKVRNHLNEFARNHLSGRVRLGNGAASIKEGSSFLFWEGGGKIKPGDETQRGSRRISTILFV
jgi:hypothetical protein